MRRLPCSAHGLTLVELLLALALTALLMVPMAAMFEDAADAGVTTGAALALDADLRFALDRIAARATAVVPAPTPPNGADIPDVSTWLAPSSYALSGTNLVETDASVAPPRTSVIAANVTAFQLSAPDIADGQLLIKAELTLAANGASAHGSRTVRLGGPP